MLDTVRDVSSPRIGLPGLLVIGGGVLLIAIAAGNGMGNRVLTQVAGGNGGIFRNVTATPVPSGTHAPVEVNWKKVQVMSVATDPAFPDPRVTPEPPPPPPPPRPIHRAWTAPPRSAPFPGSPIPAPTQAVETPYPGPEAEASAARGDKAGP
jgi:hypothetical protein